MPVPVTRLALVTTPHDFGKVVTPRQTLCVGDVENDPEGDVRVVIKDQVDPTTNVGATAGELAGFDPQGMGNLHFGKGGRLWLLKVDLPQTPALLKHRRSELIVRNRPGVKLGVKDGLGFPHEVKNFLTGERRRPEYVIGWMRLVLQSQFPTASAKLSSRQDQEPKDLRLMIQPRLRKVLDALADRLRRIAGESDNQIGADADTGLHEGANPSFKGRKIDPATHDLLGRTPQRLKAKLDFRKIGCFHHVGMFWPNALRTQFRGVTKAPFRISVNQQVKEVGKIPTLVESGIEEKNLADALFMGKGQVCPDQIGVHQTEILKAFRIEAKSALEDASANGFQEQTVVPAWVEDAIKIDPADEVQVRQLGADSPE